MAWSDSNDVRPLSLREPWKYWVFAAHGLPKQLVSDNGPQFCSAEFEMCMNKNGIKHMRSGHPATNGEVEHFVQAFKWALKSRKRDVVHLQTKIVEVSICVLYYTSSHYGCFSGWTLCETPTMHLFWIVIEKTGLVSYRVEVRGKIWRWHTDQLLATGMQVSDSIPNYNVNINLPQISESAAEQQNNTYNTPTPVDNSSPAISTEQSPDSLSPAVDHYLRRDCTQTERLIYKYWIWLGEDVVNFDFVAITSCFYIMHFCGKMFRFSVLCLSFFSQSCTILLIVIVWFYACVLYVRNNRHHITLCQSRVL